MGVGLEARLAEDGTGLEPDLVGVILLPLRDARGREGGALRDRTGRGAARRGRQRDYSLPACLLRAHYSLTTSACREGMRCNAVQCGAMRCNAVGRGAAAKRASSCGGLRVRRGEAHRVAHELSYPYT